MPVSSGNNTVELHAYPAGPVDHALALAAPGGSRLQLDLVNVADPASAGTATGGTDDGQPNTTYDWTSFSLNAEPREAGKPANCLDYDADREGRWVAIPGEEEDEWSVKWQDGRLISSLSISPSRLVELNADLGMCSGWYLPHVEHAH